MKTLPDNPNLDHLRRQAKGLLAGLRDFRPDASLADAQASLAEQYGFRTWTDLKAEVDRRRGRADVAEEALARAIAACYGLGEVIAPMRSVARPDEMGRRWSLETDRGRWAVRTMSTWRPIVDAETDFALQQAALGAGIVLPAPVRSRSGAIVESLGGHPWRVYEWVHTGPPLAAPVSAEITHEVGRILAKLHGLALPVDRISPWHTHRHTKEAWRELAATAGARRAGWAPALTATMPALAELGTIGEAAQVRQPVLSINTLGPGSVRLGQGGRLVVVGWEHAGGQPPSWELADALLKWTESGGRGGGDGVNADGARAMCDGYRAEAGSLPTLDLSSFRGAVTAWLNYAYGQVCVALQASDAEDKRYTDRSLRHLLSHLPTRASLERLLDVACATVR